MTTCLTTRQPTLAHVGDRTKGLLMTPSLNPQGHRSMPVIRVDRRPLGADSRRFVLTALIVVAIVLASGWRHPGMTLWLDPVPASASTGVTESTGTVPTAAGTVFGSWDAIVSSNVIPLGALAVGLAAVFGGIRAGSGGLIGGGIIGILAAILVAALPAIVTESASGADDGAFGVGRSALLSTLTPMTLMLYAVVRNVRRIR